MILHSQQFPPRSMASAGAPETPSPEAGPSGPTRPPPRRLAPDRGRACRARQVLQHALFAAARARCSRSRPAGTERSSTITSSMPSLSACACSTCRCRSTEKPGVSPGSGARLTISILRAAVEVSAVSWSGTRTCGITLENHDPGPSTTRSAFVIAVHASRLAGGAPGSKRTRRTFPGVVATATWPRMARLSRGSASSPVTSASMVSGTVDIGSTRPVTGSMISG